MIMYGFGFITLMFLGFLSGYMLGSHILGLSHQNSLILSIIIGTFTLFFEAGLMIFRLYKSEKDNKSSLSSQKKHATIMKLDILKNIEKFSEAKGSI
mmetsp:Transcript_39637/g.60692  ORF Transcript_39637/g.60692 Transcript_39637/m.60692 type:complete len:97 (+) Transcript_39637:816-1106(+)